ncbi:hypothetical protein [Curtobacterium herbarum]|uniref:Uncharacterized protein n=1 Tax=Curtobacterium herbarum TaxID=150122 RepID=A0ABP4JZD7_9MICO|nr:hypothetical protein [Curtobacterium herbarum]MBM7476026.1 hypothetical protein [Curtobacterium herbarum]MCS6544406.1 hypothetical protein [Curtobacterium herbarum]
MHASRNSAPRTTIPDTTAEFNAFGGALIQRVPDGPYETAGYAWEGGGRAGGITTGTTLYYDARHTDGIARHSTTDSETADLITTLHDALANAGDGAPEHTRQDVAAAVAAATWAEGTIVIDATPLAARNTHILGREVLTAVRHGHTIIAIGDPAFVAGPYETITALPAVGLGQRHW